MSAGDRHAKQFAWVRTLQLLAGLIVFLVAGSGGSGISGIVQQFDVFGPKQWLTLIAGSFVPTAPRGIIAPFKMRRATAHESAPAAASLDATDCAGCTSAA